MAYLQRAERLIKELGLFFASASATLALACCPMALASDPQPQAVGATPSANKNGGEVLGPRYEDGHELWSFVATDVAGGVWLERPDKRRRFTEVHIVIRNTGDTPLNVHPEAVRLYSAKRGPVERMDPSDFHSRGRGREGVTASGNSRQTDLAPLSRIAC